MCNTLLVTINDASENQFLVDQFSDKSGEYEGLWIGLDDAIVEGDFRWSSGSQSPYRNFYYDEPNGGLSENYVHMWSSNPWGYPVGSWNDIGDIPDNGLPDPSGKVKAFKGIAEVPIVTSIVFSPDTREGQIVTTTMRLSAGSQGTGNLMAGATIYWDISGPGITPADFGSGALSGSSIVGLDGVVVLTHAIANDLTTEGVENLQVRIFSDATKAFQVGATGSVAIQDTSVDSTLPTVASIALQGSTVILQMSEPVTATSVPVSYFSIATVSSTNTVTARTISAIASDPYNASRILITLSGTTPASTVNLRVSYTDPSGNQTSGVIQDLSGNDLASFTNRYADTYITSATTTLASQYQNLTLTGTSAINGTGNALNNLLIGNSVANILSGAAGNDSLSGGLGNDSLNGGAGNDTMVGGLGDDTYVVDVATDVITELVGEGTDLVQSAVTFSLAALVNVENLTLTGSAAINGSGNDLSNLLSGVSVQGA